MKRSLVIMLPLLAVSGCATEERPVAHPIGWQNEWYARYAVLRREPVPYPTSTPYEQDPTALGIYLFGFTLGWDEGLRASFPLRSTPFGIPYREDSERIWNEGYHEGQKLAVERLMQYMAQRQPNPQGGANGRQPLTSETNSTPAAAAPRGSP